VFDSDKHAGSTLGLMPPDGIHDDDGLPILPSPLQEHLWQRWEQYTADVKEIIASEPDATTHYFDVGDQTDGSHHGTHQVVSHDEGVHIEIATQNLDRGILTVGFDSIHMVRGTPAHVKKASGLEKAVANRLHAKGYPLVRDPKNDSFLWRKVYAEFDGILFDVRHHGKTGQLERTRRSYAALYAQDIWQTHHSDRLIPPAIAIRAHKHTFVDSGADHRGVTRAIGLPCWQFSSEWVMSKSIEKLPDIGGVVIVIRNGAVYVRPLIYQPDPEPQAIWRPE
jgi:hypothetical protein